MKNEIKKIKKEVSRYIASIEEDVYLPSSFNRNSSKKADAFQPRENKAVKTAAKEVSDNSKSQQLEALKQEVSNCRKCLLGLSRLNAVFGVGCAEAELMFIGEGPGFDEDHKGEPFVGRAGKLLDKIIEAMNLARQDVYIANIVKCHPMINPETPQSRGNDRPPTPKEISGCRAYLEKQIQIISPKVIVTLGNVATRFMLNETAPISKLRGNVYDVPETFFLSAKQVKIIPTYHPAALLRNPSLKKDTWSDMKTAMSYLSAK